MPDDHMVKRDLTEIRPMVETMLLASDLIAMRGELVLPGSFLPPPIFPLGRIYDGSQSRTTIAFS